MLCDFVMSDDEIVELAFYQRPHAFTSGVTMALSDAESGSGDESRPKSGTASAVRAPHVVDESDSEDSDAPEIIWEEVTRGKKSPKKTSQRPIQHPSQTLPPTLNASLESSHITFPGEACSKVTFLSWNVDGLSNKHLAERTLAVCHLIRSLKADIVFLQEVVPDMEQAFRQNFPGHMIILGNDEGYYTATLINKESVHYVNHNVLGFSSTKMDRNAICTEVTISGYPLLLMNTHLESMAYSSEVRKAQLRKCFRHCKGQPPEKSIIFGGDLNIRDTELEDIGGLLELMVDVWELSGRASNTCYTWDMSRNDNLDWRPGAPRPRFRFDRVYFRPSVPPHIKPLSFALVGQERLRLHKCFPSDHWGILCEFAVM